jgi:hypothetical protein
MQCNGTRQRAGWRVDFETSAGPTHIDDKSRESSGRSKLIGHVEKCREGEFQTDGLALICLEPDTCRRRRLKQLRLGIDGKLSFEREHQRTLACGLDQ